MSESKQDYNNRREILKKIIDLKKLQLSSAEGIAWDIYQRNEAIQNSTGIPNMVIEHVMNPYELAAVENDEDNVKKYIKVHREQIAKLQNYYNKGIPIDLTFNILENTLENTVHDYVPADWSYGLRDHSQPIYNNVNDFITAHTNFINHNASGIKRKRKLKDTPRKRKGKSTKQK